MERSGEEEGGGMGGGKGGQEVGGMEICSYVDTFLIKKLKLLYKGKVNYHNIW